jgi:hypothetical protein
MRWPNSLERMIPSDQMRAVALRLWKHAAERNPEAQLSLGFGFGFEFESEFAVMDLPNPNANDVA